MRLSLVSAILLSVFVFSFCSITEVAAQASNAPVSAEADQPESLMTRPYDVKLESVASPLNGWQTKVENNATLVNTAPEFKKTQSVIIEVRCIKAGVDCDVPLKSFFKNGSFEVHTGSIPAVDPDKNVGESRLSKSDAPVDSTTNVAAATQSIRRAMPVMLAKLDDDGTRNMVNALSDQGVTQSPTVVCFSGQTATLSDMSLRPFVVGVKPMVGEGTNEVAVAHQPIIQTIEDGYMFRLNPVIKDGKIDLNANLAHSKVSNVETFTVSGTEESGVTVQIPEQTLKQVNLSTSLQDGETLFLDPRLQIEVEETQSSKLPFKKSKTVTATKQVYFLVTTRIVIQEPEISTSLSQTK